MAQRQAVEISRRDLDDVAEAGDRLRRRLVGQGAVVAQLAGTVTADGRHRAIALQDEGMPRKIATDRHLFARRGVGDERRRQTRGQGDVIAELTKAVRAPRIHAAIRGVGRGVLLAGSDRHHIGQARRHRAAR